MIYWTKDTIIDEMNKVCFLSLSLSPSSECSFFSSTHSFISWSGFCNTWNQSPWNGLIDSSEWNVQIHEPSKKKNICNGNKLKKSRKWTIKIMCEKTRKLYAKRKLVTIASHTLSLSVSVQSRNEWMRKQTKSRQHWWSLHKFSHELWILTFFVSKYGRCC